MFGELNLNFFLVNSSIMVGFDVPCVLFQPLNNFW